eukprot:jgi/Bigna1/62680/fgenesh1_kg.40_\
MPRELWPTLPLVHASCYLHSSSIPKEDRSMFHTAQTLLMLMMLDKNIPLLYAAYSNHTVILKERTFTFLNLINGS